MSIRPGMNALEALAEIMRKLVRILNSKHDFSKLHTINVFMENICGPDRKWWYAELEKFNKKKPKRVIRQKKS